MTAKIQDHYPEDRYVVYSGRTDLRPGDYFEHAGRSWQAVTYPNGAILDYGNGLSIEYWEPHDSNIFDPERGNLTAIQV